MGRIRTIKPEFPQSESIGRLSRDARLLFIELWTVCDDSGRTRGNSRMLASLLFPYDADALGMIDGWLAELAKEAMIALYQFEGATYLEVLNWNKHQKIDKPTPSRLPAFDEDSRLFDEDSSTDLGPRTVDLDLGPKKTIRRFTSAHIDAIYQAYPKKAEPHAAKKAIENALQRIEGDTPGDDLLKVVREYAASPQGSQSDRELVKNPATWFNKGCYLENWKDWQEPRRKR